MLKLFFFYVFDAKKANIAYSNSHILEKYKMNLRSNSRNGFLIGRNNLFFFLKIKRQYLRRRPAPKAHNMKSEHGNLWNMWKGGGAN